MDLNPQTIVDAWQDLSSGDQMVARVIVGIVAVNLALVPLVKAWRRRG